MNAQDAAAKPGRSTVQAVRPEAVRRTRAGEPGMTLGGKYRLERPIATGGMAAVWKATHVTLNRPVAVKFIDALHGADADEHVGRFLREAKVAAAVRHKNVVDILDFGVHETSDGARAEPYMIMELLDGEGLDERLARSSMELDEVLAVIRQVLGGLDAVHASGIVHRDLKPGNVFLTDDHDGLFVRVLDFGISQGSDELPPAERTVVGTPEYMSPEQAYGDPLDRRSDIYSVGVMLYEMLAGRLPFEDPDPMKVLQLVIAGERRPLAHYRPDLVDLCPVVERAMERRPEDRFQSAREMQRALVAAVGLEVTGRFAAITRGSGRFSREATTLDLESDATAKASHPSLSPPARRSSTPPAHSVSTHSASTPPPSFAAPADPNLTQPLGVIVMPSSPPPRARSPVVIGVAVVAIAGAALAAWAMRSAGPAPSVSAPSVSAPTIPVAPTIPAAPTPAAEAARVEATPVVEEAVVGAPVVEAPALETPVVETTASDAETTTSDTHRLGLARGRSTRRATQAPTPEATTPAEAPSELRRELDF